MNNKTKYLSIIMIMIISIIGSCAVDTDSSQTTSSRNNGEDPHNITINGKTYKYTALVQVIDKETTVVGSDDSWNKYMSQGYYDSLNQKPLFSADTVVTLYPYAIGKFEVTYQFFDAVMYDDSTSDSTMPQSHASFYDAIAFCNKLSIKCGKTPCYSVEGIDDWAALSYSDIPTKADAAWNTAVCDMSADGYRLPTEAEWEFAARGGDPNAEDWGFAYSGIQSSKYVYIDDTTDDDDYKIRGYSYKTLFKDDNVHKVGRVYKSSDSESIGAYTTVWAKPVGNYKANRLGLYDMTGNVEEWVCSVEHLTDRYGNPYDYLDTRLKGGYTNSWAYTSVVSYWHTASKYDRKEPGIYRDYTNWIGFRIAQTITK